MEQRELLSPDRELLLRRLERLGRAVELLGAHGAAVEQAADSLVGLPGEFDVGLRVRDARLRRREFLGARPAHEPLEPSRDLLAPRLRLRDLLGTGAGAQALVLGSAGGDFGSGLRAALEQVEGLELDERVTGRDRGALRHVHEPHAAAHARPDADLVGLHDPRHLRRLVAAPAGDEQRDGGHRQDDERDDALHPTSL